MNNRGSRNKSYFPDNQNNFNFPSNYRDTYSRGHGVGTGRGQPPSPQHRYRRIEPSYQQDRGYTENARMFFSRENDLHQKWSSSSTRKDKFVKFKDSKKTTRNQRKARQKQKKEQENIKRKQKLVHIESSTAATTTMLNDQKSLNSPSGNNVPLIHIKGEHIEEEDRQEKSAKQQAPSPSLNSLNSFGKSEAEPSLAEQVETTANNIHTLNMANTQPKNKYEKSTDPPSSSSSATTSEANSEKGPEDPIIAKWNINKSIKTEEDIVCLGKVENNFVVEDDVDDDNDDIASALQDQCIICDKKGHSSFQCQMICMNCSDPYHNLKSCPKPSNLTVMLQTFMDFCIHQLMEFRPEQRFFTPQEVYANSSHFTPFSKRTTSSCGGLSTLGLPVAATNFAKHKRPLSRNLKKKGKKRTKSQNSDDEEDANKRDSSVDDSSASDSKSDSSEELPVEPRAKRAKTKMLMQPAYSSPFSSLPEYISPVAAAAAYNPIMFNQMLHGAFPMHAPNFNR